ncbi:lysostaphin [Arthrobacter sp. Hiyo6]|nr:lysostaphin [Arthrobacter sp. Hiyo6]
MRPVDARFPTSQPFGGGKTAAVDPNGTDPMAALVRQYGNYQPFGHAGEDEACPIGTPVYAMAPGTVLWADWGTNLPGDESEWGYRQRWYLYKTFPGIVTVIQHPWGKGVYAHKSAAWMNVGDVVSEGQQIGLSGDTGGVAPHLHVEALVDDNYTTGGGLIYGRTDPRQFFGSSGMAAQGSITTPAAPAYTYTENERFILDLFGEEAL